MNGYSRSIVKVGDPYAFIALAALKQVFNDIECYFTGHGSEAEIIEGKKSLRWVRRMEGNFRVLASATSMPIEEFHQKCIYRINQIRKEAYARQRLRQ